MKTRNLTKITLSAILLMSVPSQAATTVLLTDNFNTADNTNISQNLATRQSGTLATSTYNEHTSTNSAISGNRLQVASNSGVNSLANLKASITASTDPFSISFDLSNTGTTSWAATYLSSTNNSDTRGSSPFGFHLWNEASLNGVVLYGGSFGGQATTGLTKAQLDTALGATFQANVLNSYQFLASPTTGTTGTYDFLINNVLVAEDIAYNFGTSNLFWASRTNTNGVGVYDNLNISIVPEPSAIALFAVAGMGLVMRRHR